MAKSPDDWARGKTDDLLRELLAETNRDDNDTGFEDAIVGQLYSGLIHVGGFKLSLPPGYWSKLAKCDVKLPTASGVGYFLGRIRLKRLVGAVRVFAVRSKPESQAGFEGIKLFEQNNPNNYFVCREFRTPFDKQAGWLIQNYYATPWRQWADRGVDGNDLDRAAARDMASKGVTYPQDFVLARFSCAEKWGLFEVSYLFSPEAEGLSSSTVLSSAESEWHASNVERFPEKLAYLAKLKDWGTSLWPQFKTAFAEAKY